MAFEKKQQGNKSDDRLKDYIQVNDRIMAFWKEHPNGRIHTEIVSWQDGVLIMRAFVWKNMNDVQPAAIGHAYEKEGSSYINNGSILENCETSVVGRALAIMGYEIKRSVASREEVANAIHQQEEAANEPDRINDPAIKSKWGLLAGNLDGYEEGIKKLRNKGMTYAQIEAALTDKIKQKQVKAEEQPNE